MATVRLLRVPEEGHAKETVAGVDVVVVQQPQNGTGVSMDKKISSLQALQSSVQLPAGSLKLLLPDSTGSFTSSD